MQFIRALLAAILLALPALAQTVTLKGQVSDESGGVVPGATVTLQGPRGFSKTTVSGNDGSYSFAGLPLGSYTVSASAPGLVLSQAVKIPALAGDRSLNLVLHVAAEKQQVTVADNSGPSVSTDASANASAVVLRGADLDALSDDPDDLAADLQALAGPAAGPSGGSIFIDGFSGGQLPPKDAIREIRINQNPFSPEYDKLGFGRIDIFTNPGSDKFHGDLGYNFASDKWNSRNAYAAQKAPFLLNELRNNLSGPLGKRASFNLTLIREWTDNGNVVNGVTLAPAALVAIPFTATPVSALRRTGITPRVDYQLSKNHTLSVRYSFNRDDVRNAGTGGFNLVSQGFHNDATNQTAQITETAVLNNSTMNETRFQFWRPTTVAEANTPGYAVQVLGAFNGGGNPIGHSTDAQNNYEFQNNTTIIKGPHSWRFGARFRGTTETNAAPQNFAGTFTFGGGLAPELDANNAPVLDAAGQPVLMDISSIESYRRTLLFQQMGLPAPQIRRLGGGASQFTMNAGDPLIAASQFDLGVFAGDEWKVQSNLTLDLGLRYEAQTNIHDWRDFAPRIGVAWAPGASGSSRHNNVIRAGFGMFYDRFALANLLTALRYNGITQQQYVIDNPNFFPGTGGALPAITSLTGTAAPSSIEQISSQMRAPYLMQSALGYERQLPYNTTLAVTYANSHGLHQLRSEDINAPLPGTGVFPLGRPGFVGLMESSGLYNQNQIIVNVNSRINRDISLTGSYTYNRAMSNTDGLGTFPSTPYSMVGEYGPAATDMHHRVLLGGTIIAKWGIRFNPLLTMNSGPPFDITAGRDLYGDTLFNARPGIATDPNKPGVIATPYGLLDPNPVPGEPLLPRNFGRGPGQIMLNMRVGRTFGFGRVREGGGATASLGGSPATPGGGSGGNRNAPSSPFGMGGGGSSAAGPSGHRFTLTISMQIRNLLNHNNPGPIIGNITSPLFGQANQPAGVGNAIFSESANNRRLELQTRLTF